MDLAATLALMPPGSLVPVEWVLSQLSAAPAVGESERRACGDLTVEEVAARMHRKPSTVRGWCSAGILRSYKLQGRDWRVTEDALREFVQAQRDAATPPGEGHTARPRVRASAADLGSWRRVRAVGGSK